MARAGKIISAWAIKMADGSWFPADGYDFIEVAASRESLDNLIASKAENCPHAREFFDNDIRVVAVEIREIG